MDNPTGCGSSTCGTRFCFTCLERVLNTGATATNSQQQPTDPPQAKCPHCRSIFTLQTMVKDDALRKEMEECNDTVTCPFVDCGTKLHISQVKAHEAKLLFPAEPERDLPTKMERILRISAELMYSGHSGTENAKKQSYST